MEIAMKRMMIKTMLMIMVQSLIIDDASKMIWMTNMLIMIRNCTVHSPQVITKSLTWSRVPDITLFI